ncbi:MAG TPA: type II secretion system protein [Geobacteraceae bacterium]|nr:type II secretion system protein [Geobacteraceae bacterium]
MNRRGFTITELLVVIAIISILLALATMGFHQWQVKANVESEVKQLYADIRNMQQQAMVRLMTHRVNFASMNNVTFLRFTDETDVTGTQILQKNLSYAITLSSSFPASPNQYFEFNNRGLMIDPATKAICIYSDSGATVDSIVIMQSRINLGKLKNMGGACDVSNIDLK